MLKTLNQKKKNKKVPLKKKLNKLKKVDNNANCFFYQTINIFKFILINYKVFFC